MRVRLSVYLMVLLASILSFACNSGESPRHSIIFSDESSSYDSIALYDLKEIQESGLIICGTLNGPDTYFEYHGIPMGTQFLLAQEFATSIGVRLQVEIAPDTATLLRMLSEGDVDFIALENPRWKARHGAKALEDALMKWWNPDRKRQVTRMAMREMTVRRRTSRPFMIDRKQGIISHYDHLFVKYSSIAGMDWRLLAAQCYQESGFDSKATSWVGAQGLMQIMPSTASLLGLSRQNIFDPESNIRGGANYLRLLRNKFADIRNPMDRQMFVLAAYNGGFNHITDARSLARKHGVPDDVWQHVSPFVLKLSDPRYYRDPVVRNGYMRGQETVNYVSQIMDRWYQYRGHAKPAHAVSEPSPSRRRLEDGIFKSKVKSADEWLKGDSVS